MQMLSLNLNSFVGIILHLSRVDSCFDSFVDGGAGLGETAEQIIRSCIRPKKKLLAFEPNPANTAAFINRYSDKISLIPEALGACAGISSFQITSTTIEDSSNPFRVPGTSYVGKLAVDSSDNNITTIMVPVVRLIDKLKEFNFSKIDFLKLDLQGGELDALIGLDNMLSDTKIIWLEFTGQPELLKFIYDAGFVAFDTDYLFVGDPNDLIKDLFRITSQGVNTIGKKIFFGQRRHLWDDYEKVFDFMKRRRRLIQTDLVLVNNSYLEMFNDIAERYASKLDNKIPDLLKKVVGHDRLF